MDGNHRWALERGLPGAIGHRRGARNVEPVVEACADTGVRYLTLFAFSTENWNRPRHEIDSLINLIRESLQKDLDKFDEKGVQLTFVGDRTRFPSDLQRLMTKCEIRTRNNSVISIIIALNFGGRWELVNAARKIGMRVQDGELDPLALDEVEFQRYLASPNVPPPDLCIRTGGDQRLSNFLLWDLAYTELFFTDTYWPEFDRGELIEAFHDYNRRKRRYGSRAEITPYRATN